MPATRTRNRREARTGTTDPASWAASPFRGRRGRRLILVLLEVVGEAAVSMLAVAVAYLMMSGWPSGADLGEGLFSGRLAALRALPRTPEFAPVLPILIVSPALHILIFNGLGLYGARAGETRPFAATGTLFKGTLLALGGLALLTLGYGPPLQRALQVPHLFLFFNTGLTFLGVLLVHSGLLIGALALRALGVGRQRLAVVYGGEAAAEVLEAFHSPLIEYDFAGLILAPGTAPPDDDPAPACLGSLEDLPALINRHRLDALVLAVDPEALSAPQRLETARTCWQMGVDLKMIVPFQPYFRTDTEPEMVGDLALFRVRNLSLYATAPQVLKRLTDIAGAAAILLVASPVMLLAAILIKLDSKGPVFFVQERVGLNGRTFRMLKFRSMRSDADDSVHREYLRQLIQKAEAATGDDEEGPAVFKLTDDPRITRVGKIIRKTSIDELPQLINVLRGEMSLVGPRPAIPYEVGEYKEWHLRRLHIRPGITGLWQVSGRSLLSFDQMVALDIAYIENWSLWLDLKILFRTLPVVFNPRQAY